MCVVWGLYGRRRLPAGEHACESQSQVQPPVDERAESSTGDEAMAVESRAAPQVVGRQRAVALFQQPVDALHSLKLNEA